jgi:dTDP-4-amino-4,6-dideoxygalactose transaminase
MKVRAPSLALYGGEPIRSEKLPIFRPYIDADDRQSLLAALDSNYLSGDGPLCRAFEEQLAEYLGVKHALFVTSCTAALDLAYKVQTFPVLGEVLVPDYTFTSTGLAPALNNLQVVLVDVDPLTGNINPSILEQKITEKTVALSPVDYAGISIDIDAVKELALRYGLYVVHDAAQSIGTRYKGRRVGSDFDVTCFSFHATKNLAIGEGGALVTNSDDIARQVRIMRDKGTDKYNFITNKIDKGFYNYLSIGNSYVHSNLLAALGLSQLAKLDTLNAIRGEIAQFYLSQLADISNITPMVPPEYCDPNWHLFCVFVRSEDRDWIVDALNAEGIGARSHYVPLHLTDYYNETSHFSPDEFPGSSEFYGKMLRLPISATMSMKDAQDVINAVEKVFTHRYSS